MELGNVDAEIRELRSQRKIADGTGDFRQAQQLDTALSEAALRREQLVDRLTATMVEAVA